MLSAVLQLLIPLSAGSAGLGRLTVLSDFGQSFHAEIELISDGDLDLSALTARLASPETYHQFSLPYGTAQAGLLVILERRQAGSPYIKITSVRYINEPFVSLLIELDGPAGRLVRSYTALLDLPPLSVPATPQARGLVADPGVRPAPAIARPDATRVYGPVQRGETMGKIARELKREGVSLVQMIIGLFHGNPGAFIRRNLNLVKAGEILRVPAKEEAAATPHGEAVKEFRDQVAAWKAYSARMADAAGTREARDGARDVTRVSRNELPGGAAGSGAPGGMEERARILEEDAIAGDKALADTRDRIAQLEKTVKDMRRLAEVDRQGMVAPPEQGAAQPGATPETAPTGAMTSQPPAAPLADQAAVPPATKAEQPKGGIEVVAPTPRPESGLIDAVMANLPLVGGGAAAVLFGGLLLARRRRLKIAAENEAGRGTVESVVPDGPDAGTPATDLVLDAEEAKPNRADDFDNIDFEMALPKVDESPEELAEAASAEGGDQDADSGRKFEVDLSGINLELDDEPRTGPAPGAGAKDPHWHDVQEKFELAKAYQVFNEDLDSVIEILRDIVKEGDAQQRAEARKLMDGLSGKDK